MAGERVGYLRRLETDADESITYLYVMSNAGARNRKE